MRKEDERLIELTKETLEIQKELGNEFIKHVEGGGNPVDYFRKEETMKLGDRLDEIANEREKIMEKLLTEMVLKCFFDNVDSEEVQ